MKNRTKTLYFTENKIFTSEDNPAFQPDFIPPLRKDLSSNPQLRKLRKNAQNKVRKLAFQILGNAANWSEPQSKVDGRAIRNIIVFRYDAIGDFIVTSPIFRWLQQALPQANVDVVSSYRNDMIMKNDPLINNSIAIDPKHECNASWLKVLRAAQHTRYDLVIAPIFTKITKAAILARFASKTAPKITFRNYGRESIYGHVFDYQVPTYPWREHAIDRMIRIVTTTIEPAQPVDDTAARPYLLIEQSAWNKIRSLLLEKGLGFQGFNRNVVYESAWNGPQPGAFEGHPYCVVNISSFMKAKQWEVENCAEVCRQLLQKYPHMRIFITGAPDAFSDIRTIEAQVGSARCWGVSFSFAEYICLVSASTIVVTPDSAAIHIASTAEKPVAGLYARFDSTVQWYPRNVPYALALSASEKVIHDITPEMAIKAFDMTVERAGLEL